ncbi:Rieske (2Fe-2S) protein [Cognaticolwellia mytili]|uniref:Rieske (2Fe-2S) protein n=1 Tax=Cognaticolwellia mytili TaxID=1888913 RepID=UPI0013020C21|nr:Rieske 2Fe-2S domain-containing protein [Cognaticolwellia mytili]
MTIKEYFPPGGLAKVESEITDITYTDRNDVILGQATLPLSNVAKKVAIYCRKLDNGKMEYRAVSAKCPHQGADISQDELKPDGNVYCSLHRRPICIFSEYNYAYLVEKRGEKFFISKSVK